ncbi:cupin domain-containing protein [Patescibacteria group bacterium]|nr:cupin domain-containing protein [Patescibacteria group bacterium]
MTSTKQLCFSTKDIKLVPFSVKSGPGTHYNLKMRELIKRDRHIFEKTELVIMNFQPGGYTVPHSHPGREQAYYVLRGKASVKVGNEQCIVKKSDVVLIPRNTLHSYKVIGKELFKFLIIDVELVKPSK